MHFAGSTESFSHLCLLQGILSHADSRTLAFMTTEAVEIIDFNSAGLSKCLGAGCHSVALHHTVDEPNDECGSTWFLLQLLPAIKQLCTSAKFKYHAFRLLQLWISRLKSVYQNSSRHSQLHECLASVENDLLELLAGHMDCCVDGVNDLIGDILDSVMQLDKLLHSDTSECWTLLCEALHASTINDMVIETLEYETLSIIHLQKRNFVVVFFSSHLCLCLLFFSPWSICIPNFQVIL